MLIKEILNEYELDAVESILENKQLHIEQLKEKRIICLGSDGNSLARAIVCSFLVLNDKYKANIMVYYMTSTNVGEEQGQMLLPEELIQRQDLTIVDKGTLPTLPAVDYFIDSGFCNRQVAESDLEGRQALVSEIMGMLKNKGMERYLLLSDYRSYGTVPAGVLVAEQEYSSSQHAIRRYENYCIAQAEKAQVSYLVLRSAILLGGADIGCHSIHKLMEQCACKEKITLQLNPAKYTGIYLSDLLGAVIFATGLNKVNEIYNVAGKDATVTAFDLGRILSETITDPTLLTYTNGNGEEDEPVALDTAKLLLAGYTGTVSVLDGFEMALKARLNNQPFFLFHDTYNGKLPVIQQLMLQVILEIDAICKRHNINYFLGGGTLLGAIRHQGFIPWDDDADIMMLREDYERFTEVAAKELPDYLQLQTARTDKNNHFFSKVRVKDTTCATEFTKKLSDINVGFFVDIFPHDYTANSRFGQKLHQNMTVFARSLVFNKWGGTYVRGNGGHRFTRFVATIIKSILPMRFLEWQQFAIIEHYKHKKNRHFLYDGMGQNLRKGPFPKEWLKETIYVPFESVQLPVPKDYDKYLTHLYGDYMQMVGVSKRKNSHNIYLLDLGQYMEKMGNNSMQE